MILASQIAKGYPTQSSGDCYPSSTFCCENEYSYNCTLTTNGFGNKNIFKKEKRTITWPIGMFTHEDVIYPHGWGECGISERPCKPSVRYIEECWPQFNPPLESEYNYWLQEVNNKKASPSSCFTFCGFITPTFYNCIDCRDTIEGSATPFEVLGPCTGGGGEGDGSGGDGDDDGGNEGCVDCNCYYETIYVWTNYEDGCGDKWRQSRQICNGEVRWEGPMEYIGWDCEYY